jgi:molybdate transport system substrate-binding protein
LTVNQPIHILSADAPKVGLRKNAEAFSVETGIPNNIELATGPVIKERVLSGNTDADLIVIPRAEFDDLIAAGHFDPTHVAVLGLVTVGVTVKNGAREPDLSSVDAFVESVLAADRVIYNTASSGQYIARMFERLGLTEKIRHKASIYPTGGTAMQALAADTTGNAIGFGHVTEIRLHDPIGTHLVGPLPGEIGRQTPYAIGLRKASQLPEAARQLIDFMVSARGKQTFLETGVLQS